MESSSALQAAPGVVFQEVEGEMVLLDLEGERYYVLDDIGTRCWQLLNEHGDVEKIVASMLAEFDVDEATLRSDIDALLGRLSEARLVTRSDAG
jgi:hypothetical protein